VQALVHKASIAGTKPASEPPERGPFSEPSDERIAFSLKLLGNPRWTGNWLLESEEHRAITSTHPTTSASSACQLALHPIKREPVALLSGWSTVRIFRLGRY
jgi:hypothetical protein